MSRIFFLTTHGTLLTRGTEGAPRHADLRSLSDPAELATVEGDIGALRHDFRGFLESAPRPPLAAETDWLGRINIHPDPATNLVHLERDGAILSAAPTGGVTTWMRGEPREWERLLPIAESEFGQLLAVFSNDWVVRSNRRVVHSWAVRFEAGHALRLGEVSIPLARNLPLLTEAFPFRFTALRDGWRHDEVVLFKPLVYYAAYGAPAVHRQLHLSLRSLAEFGNYTGHVHVLTDLDVETICREGGVARDRVSVQHLAPRDFAGFVGSKYAILEHDPAWSFQPLCFLDPDIIANAGLEAMLVEMALADTLTAPVEEVGPQRSWPSVGATLLQRDGRDPRFANGFNAGTLGIPNLPRHAHTLRTIRRIIENLLKQEGRESLRWVDQEVANYVSFVAARVDTVAISRFVRYGGGGDAERPGPLTGLVHFWAAGKADRDQVMARYLDTLREHARAAHKLSS